MQVKLRKVKLASSPEQLGAVVNDQPRKTIDGSNDGLIAMLIALEDRQHLSRVDFPPGKNASKLIRCFTSDCLIMLAHFFLFGLGPVKISLSMVDSPSGKNKV
jgi:hypothetical protein